MPRTLATPAQPTPHTAVSRRRSRFEQRRKEFLDAHAALLAYDDGVAAGTVKPDPMHRHGLSLLLSSKQCLYDSAVEFG